MVRCENCWEISENEALKYDYEEGGFYSVCRFCGSDNIKISEAECSLCGNPLYSGELAYETKNELFCSGCIKEVMI